MSAVSSTTLTRTRMESWSAPSSARDLLTWLNDPAGTRQRWDESTWAAFRNVCRQQYNFDPHTDGELVGAELGARSLDVVERSSGDPPALGREHLGGLPQCLPSAVQL